MLHLVPNTPTPDPNLALLNKETDCPSFLFASQEISPKLFSCHAQDTMNALGCSLLLDRQDIFLSNEQETAKEIQLVPMFFGNFPSIDGAMLYHKVWGNEYLQSSLTTRFYLNLLKSLFLICKEENTNGLVFNVDDHDQDLLEIYRNFIMAEAQVMTSKGEQTQIMISATAEAYDKLMDLIEKVNQDLHQTLWRNHKDNPIFRIYLKSYALAQA